MEVGRGQEEEEQGEDTTGAGSCAGVVPVCFLGRGWARESGGWAGMVTERRTSGSPRRRCKAALSLVQATPHHHHHHTQTYTPHTTQGKEAGTRPHWDETTAEAGVAWFGSHHAAPFLLSRLRHERQTQANCFMGSLLPPPSSHSGPISLGAAAAAPLLHRAHAHDDEDDNKQQARSLTIFGLIPVLTSPLPHFHPFPFSYPQHRGYSSKIQWPPPNKPRRSCARA